MQTVLPCVVCGCELRPIISTDVADNHPSGALSFQSEGQFGSVEYDPLDGSYIEINICSPCLRRLGQKNQVAIRKTPTAAFELWVPDENPEEV